MNLKAYFWLIGFASALALCSFFALLWFFSPQNANAPILILLFISLFLALCGIFSLAALYFRRRRNRDQIIEDLLGVSFREGSLLSGLLVGFLLMQFFNIFYWWLALIFLIIVVAIEAVFLAQNIRNDQAA